MWFLFNLDPGHAGPAELGDVLGANIYAEWLRLDRILTQLWESHSIRLRVFLPCAFINGWGTCKGLYGASVPGGHNERHS